MISEGFDATPMIAFLDNLMLNPSKRAVDELYGFLEATKLPITDDGCFLAYKRVRNDYLDYYTGKVDNSIGQKPSMPRNQVDDDKNRTCSKGLHFCSLSYLPHYHGSSGRIVILKINPRDVVSIPTDYNNAKGRACLYEVIAEHTSENTEAFNSSVYFSGNSDDYDDDRDYFDNDEDDNYTVAQYDAGYNTGADKALNDIGLRLPYNDVYTGFNSDANYINGFTNGYKDTYYIDWVVLPAIIAAEHFSQGVQYCDTPPLNTCPDVKSYRMAYATAWRDAMRSSI